MVRWYYYGMTHDPAKRVGFCDRCCTLYEGTPAEVATCTVCGAVVIVPTP